MGDYGDSKVQYTGQGYWTSADTYSVDSNTTQKVTKSLINLSSSNDFSVEVQTKNGGTHALRPDTLDDLEKAAKKMLDKTSNLAALEGDSNGERTFKIVQNGKEIGEITPQAMLDAIAKARNK